MCAPHTRLSSVQILTNCHRAKDQYQPSSPESMNAWGLSPAPPTDSNLGCEKFQFSTLLCRIQKPEVHVFLTPMLCAASGAPSNLSFEVPLKQQRTNAHLKGASLI